ncbi:uncharacterized protein FIBRA_00160 [Fibroporia radiculosa]|uniref:Uncharacterized protein n=1 Tax=Fibroporia radiculosa TaxID=599839 RepID=J7SBW2_9APHY|nr:uncharacterized protein FIBRA_00160 [Fibroporia radiculosa]CCL98166.1 predicted protein [Fibroporia radiculosa]
MNGASRRATLRTCTRSNGMARNGVCAPADDRGSFRSAFEESVRTRRTVFAHVRLQRKHDLSMVSDYSSHPHVLPDTAAFQCFFAVAKPYPSRNTAMLNMVLELKMENERLQQCLIQLRAQAGAPPGTLDTAALDGIFVCSLLVAL